MTRHPQSNFTHEQLRNISKNMREYGGSFVKCLGAAMEKADAQNLLKLERAFPEYFLQYHLF